MPLRQRTIKNELIASQAKSFHIIIRLDEDDSPIETKYSGCQGRGEIGLNLDLL